MVRDINMGATSEVSWGLGCAVCVLGLNLPGGGGGFLRRPEQTATIWGQKFEIEVFTGGHAL